MDFFAIIDAAKDGLAWICLCVLSLIAAAYVLAGLRGAWRTLRARLNPFAVCAFAVVSVFAAVEAQKRASGGAARTTHPARESARPRASVTQEEIERGWRFVVETNCEAGVYAMPDGVSPSFNWHKRGTFGEWARLDLGNFAFPLGADGGEFTSFSVFNDGRIRPTPRDAAHEIRAVGVPMLAMQGTSRFWTASGTDGSKLLTWENFFLHADTNAPINAQIELFANGDFTTRSNNVERIFCRIEPFDWDGDGLENSVDPDPLVAGPDAHGTNDEWYDAVCSGVANSNAYYFVDVVVERGPAPVFFTGDRESRLGDPVVVALAGKTNRVPLLMGVEYAVTSSMPLDVWAEDEYATIVTNNARNYTVSWPLSFCVAASQDGGYSIDVQPFDPGGGFSWNMAAQGGGAFRTRSVRSTPGCTYTSASNWIGFTCGSLGDCGCHGCSVDGTYSIEDALFALPSIWCMCSLSGFTNVVPEMAALEISFNKSAVMFENAYENSPGEWIDKRSTEVELSICASGGTNGAVVTLSSINLEKLSAKDGKPVVLPGSVTLPPHATYYASYLCEGARESASENDIKIEGNLIENSGSAAINETTDITVVRIDLKTRRDAPRNTCIGRHIHGIGEEFFVYQYPSCPVVTPVVNDATLTDLGGVKIITWGVSNITHSLSLRISDLSYDPLVNVLVPSGIEGVNVEARTNGLPSGIAGGIELRQCYRVLPLSVSFEGIAIEEVPCDEVIPPDGYFAYTPTNIFYRSHTRAAGAGRWIGVGSGNYVGGIDAFDKAGYHGPLPRMTEEGTITSDPSYGWLGGSLTWKIPFGWQTNPAPSPLSDPVWSFADNTRQIFRITANGDFSIEKLGHVATRTLSGDVTVTNCPAAGVLRN